MKLDDQLALIEEFERSAESRRRKAVQDFDEDERRFSDLRRREAKREEKEHRLLEEGIAATSEQIARFQERLDRYDAGTVAALMDNRRALDQAEDGLADIRHRAVVLPDGRLVYRSADGEHVFDDSGNRVGRDIIDPVTISTAAPTWEERQAAGQTVRNLTTEREGLLAFQAKIDHAREQAGRDGVTRADLQGLGDDLDRAMPEALRRRLNGPDQTHKPDTVSTDQPSALNPMPATPGTGASGRPPAPGSG